MQIKNKTTTAESNYNENSLNCFVRQGMVYFLGDWGMGDSDLSSYQQHVPNIQQQQHQHIHGQQQQQQQQQLVAQISTSLNLLQPQLQFASGSNFLQQSPAPSPQHHQHVVGSRSTNGTNPSSSSSLVTANLQQLSVSSGNNNSSCNTHTKSQQQQQLQQQIDSGAALKVHPSWLRQCSESASVASDSCGKAKTPQLSKDLLDNEDEVALHPLSNQVSLDITEPWRN